MTRPSPSSRTTPTTDHTTAAPSTTDALQRQNAPRPGGSRGSGPRRGGRPLAALIACALALAAITGPTSCTGHRADQDPAPDSQDLMTTAAAPASASQDTALGDDLIAKRDQARAADPPVQGEQINDDSPEGATLSAYYFLLLYRYAFMTGSTDDINAMSDTECVFCRSFMDGAKKLHDEGGWVDYWDITVDKTTYHDPTDTFPYVRLDTTVTTSEATNHSGDGTETISPADREHTLTFAMYHNGTRWIVREVKTQ
ncbi:DUF6318 family protein [uncultured Actinomyces sp.]|uniref:DUF6318 family protein n=1 Tax=uncultured Actinomyces sp. TaxID=249061 RepID=UPI0028E7E9DD|nr:DUF6318 family protein [uncultured Actinomyces sp.]